MTVLVETAPHEFAANFLFAEHGLNPFFATDRRVKDGGGSQRGEFDLFGEEWLVTLYYQESGLEHPGEKTPAGTRFTLQEMREFRLAVRAKDDPVGKRKFTAHLAPRWHGMRSKDGREIPVPAGVHEGVNVRVSGANIEFDQYLPLLRMGAVVVGIADRYFENPHEYSNIQDAERYVRLHKSISGPVHARDGPLARMGHLLENDRQGYRKIVQNDDDIHGENLPGYYHTVTLGQRRIREAFPNHQLPKEIKHYYAREAASRSEDDPLAHPKLGSSYQVNRWDETLRADSEGIAQLNRELEETVISVLAEAGIPIRPTEKSGGRRGAFVPDAYFEATESERDLSIIRLDLSEIRQSQESIVVRQLADGLSPIQEEVLDKLVTDGGVVSPGDIADQFGRHVGSVWRALRDMEQMVDREYGKVSLRSPFVAEMVQDALSEARNSVTRLADTGAKVSEASRRGLDDTMSAFVAWAAKHGIDPNDERDARLQLRFRDAESSAQRRRLVQTGYDLWTEAGRDPARYRTAQVTFGDRRGMSVAHYWL